MAETMTVRELIEILKTLNKDDIVGVSSNNWVGYDCYATFGIVKPIIKVNKITNKSYTSYIMDKEILEENL